VVRLAPIGIFGIAGYTSGTLSIEQFGLLQGYLIVYGLAAVLLSLWILPALLACCTPYSEREILVNSRDMLITSFIIGNTFVVLPLIVDAVKRLLAQHGPDLENPQNTPEYAVQLAYPFPDVGRIMVMVFIPFAAWFYGRSVDPSSLPQLLGVGFIGAFAKPIVTVPLLLEVAEIPGDIFNLFLAVGVVASRFGDAMKCMHLFAFSILTASIVSGTARLDVRRLVTRGLITIGLLAVIVLSIRSGLAYSFTDTYEKQDLISARKLVGTPVTATIARQSVPHRVPLTTDMDPMDRILTTGVLRIGIQPNNLPFTYYNLDGNLVGFDIDMAHQMAHDLGDIQIEFVHYSGDVTVALHADHFDIAMSGLEGTIRRATELPEMEPYLEVTRALVVPDHRRKDFRSLSHLKKTLKKRGRLRIAVITDDISADASTAESALGTGWGAVTSLGLDEQLEIVGVADASEFFAGQPELADVLATSAEAGSAWTLRYPGFAVVKPNGLNVRSPLYYLVAETSRFEDFVNSWLKLKRRDGTIDQLYDYWILGQEHQLPTPRWCVVRNVLHWID
jgi:ABC-type amino acid transport substrate-binding protein